jgi:hypothetical protein
LVVLCCMPIYKWCHATTGGKRRSACSGHHSQLGAGTHTYAYARIRTHTHTGLPVPATTPTPSTTYQEPTHNWALVRIRTHTHAYARIRTHTHTDAEAAGFVEVWEYQGLLLPSWALVRIRTHPYASVRIAYEFRDYCMRASNCPTPSLRVGWA